MSGVPAALRREVVRRVEPTAQRTRQARAAARELIRRIRTQARRKRLVVEPKLVGSLAKDTHLSEPLDIDVFILFPQGTTRKQLETHGIALGKAILDRPTLRYAEHPYVHGTHAGFTVDVVPAYKLKSAAGRLSAVDRTPFHTRYVARHARPLQRREIRLLKRFLRGTGCYGAETATGGLSGYIAELLVLRFGTFTKTLEAIVRWRPPVRLALEGDAEPFGGPFVFVDPVDASRNAAAAVSEATLARLQRAARAFLQKPRLAFFFPAPPVAWPVERLERELSSRPLLGVWTPLPLGREDTRGPQSHRLLAKLRRLLAEEGFSTKRDSAFVLPTGLLLLIEHDPAQLPPRFLHRGPRAEDAANADRFLSKWSRHPDRVGPPRVADGRHVVEVRRAETRAAAILAPLIPALLQGFDFGPNADATAKVLAAPELTRAPEHHRPLSEFMSGKDPWEW